MKLIKKVQDNENTVYKNQDYYQHEFLIRRAKITKKAFDKGSIETEEIYANEYIEQCTLAAGGDVVAQDLLSYWFKHGNPALDENIELSMKWLFLAGAGGNKHSISKLAIFLNYYYDTIIQSDYFKQLSEIFIITNDNYQELLGQVICQKLVEEMNINALDLAKEKPNKLLFNQTSMQKFTLALNHAMPKVDEYFRNLIQNHKN